MIETPEEAGAAAWWGTLTLTFIVLALIAIAVATVSAISTSG